MKMQSQITKQIVINALVDLHDPYITSQIVWSFTQGSKLTFQFNSIQFYLYSANHNLNRLKALFRAPQPEPPRANTKVTAAGNNSLLKGKAEPSPAHKGRPICLGPSGYKI